ncbi:MMPL family transporter [Streptomyces scopuliridis]|uniref:MMPL family transporter n=1 Tax=Streptomyces scopuliridis TaxID=452529 RepID=UPI0036B15E1A
MSLLLEKIGAYCARNRVGVVVAWLGVLGVALLLTLGGPKSSDSGFEIPGSESTTALRTLNREFPKTVERPGTAALQFVFAAPKGQKVSDGELTKAILASVRAAGELPGITSASDPFTGDPPAVSPNGRVAVSTLTAVDLDDSRADAVAEELLAAGSPARAAGLEVELGGALSSGEPELFGPTEVIGAGVALLVLLLTYGTLTAAGATMGSALIGVAVGILGVLGYATLGSGIESTTPILAVMLGLAVGIDYSLFIVARFRDELRAGSPVHEAAGRAAGTAGTAVTFAGATVIVALAGLAVVGIPVITEMGLAGAFAVLVAVAVALTLLPALLVTLGRRLLPRRERLPSAGSTTRPQSRVLSRWARFVTGRPLVALLGGTALLCTLTLPVLSMSTELLVPGGDDPKSTRRAAHTLLTDAFGAGSQDPLIVLVQGDGATQTASRTASVLSADPSVASVSPTTADNDDENAYFAVLSRYGPTDVATSDLADRIRTTHGSTDQATVSVTGSAAVDLDAADQLDTGLIVYLFCVIGLSLLLLILMFRSLLVPLLATLGFLLSLGAGMGVTTAVFQWGWAGGLVQLTEARPLSAMLPLIVTGVLFGLAMDYQVFMVSRIQEAHGRGLPPFEAVLDGFRRASVIVIAAAAIMAAVFAGFVLSGAATLVSSMSLALTVGVLADALIVRMVLVPSLLVLAGKKAWWLPQWLDRILPVIDHDGSTTRAKSKETPLTPVSS